jgi:hypothetical protein
MPMANPLMDEFSLTLAGTSYRFRWGLGELIEMQEQLIDSLGRVPTVEQMDVGVRQGRLKYLRAMIWAGLRPDHPTIAEAEVTVLMRDASQDEMQQLLTHFGYVIRPDPVDLAALPKPKPETRRPGRPRKAQIPKTNGAASTAPPVAVV